jgi:hypothetical protein
LSERKLPPVTQLGAASLASVATGVIVLASYLPKHAPLAIPVACLAVAAALLATNLFLLSRIPEFAWWRFREVFRWGLLAYLVISGMLEYTFLYDHTRGAVLAVMTAMLVLFATNVPLLLAYTVAVHQTGPRE